MNKWILCLSLLIACMVSIVQAQHPVSFFEEHIDFVIDSACFSINGIYSFRNASDKPVNQHIIFPFADKTSGIDSIRIVNLNTLKKIPFIRLESSVSFEFEIPPKDTIDLNIFYRQKAAAKNTYIITSTQTWGKPLETAVYTLTTEKNLRIKSFSYSPDSSKTNQGKILYKWEKHQFMPVKDFEITIGK